jgi:hypothetical protein
MESPSSKEMAFEFPSGGFSLFEAHFDMARAPW